jgi:hypothetical protein
MWQQLLRSMIGSTPKCLATQQQMPFCLRAGNPDQGSLTEGEGSLDLLVLTILDQLLFILKILFTFTTKQRTLTRRSTVPNLPPVRILCPYKNIYINH